MAWQPEQEPLRQLSGCLRDTLSGHNKSAQKQAEIVSFHGLIEDKRLRRLMAENLAVRKQLGEGLFGDRIRCNLLLVSGSTQTAPNGFQSVETDHYQKTEFARIATLLHEYMLIWYNYIDASTGKIISRYQ